MTYYNKTHNPSVYFVGLAHCGYGKEYYLNKYGEAEGDSSPSNNVERHSAAACWSCLVSPTSQAQASPGCLESFIMKLEFPEEKCKINLMGCVILSFYLVLEEKFVIDKSKEVPVRRQPFLVDQVSDGISRPKSFTQPIPQSDRIT